jgi:hypothetical protein
MHGSLDISLVPVDVRRQVQKYFNDGDGRGIVFLVGKNSLRFVLDNMMALKARGIYEPALVTAYTHAAPNWWNWQLNVLNRMFKQADCAKLLSWGDPLPPGESYALYRGVAGKGKCRHVSGMSWTSDLDKAIWFARRSFQPDPAVYRTIANREDVCCYLTDRNEDVFILQARRYRRLDICPKRLE